MLKKYPKHTTSEGYFSSFACETRYNWGMNTIYDKQYWTMPCAGHSCRKTVEGLMFVSVPATLGDDGAASKVAPKKGAYSNAIVEYEANGAVYIYSSEGIPVNIKEGE